MDTIETVIIGAGQAGLATAYHLTKQGRDCVVLDRNQRRRRQLAAAVGQPAALHPGQVRRPARHAVPRRRRGRSRARTRSPTTSRPTPPASSLPVRLGTRVDRLAAAADGDGFVVSTDAGRIALRQRRRRDRHLRADAEHPRLRRRTSTRRSCSCTRASTAGPASSATARSSSSAPRTPAATSPTRWPQTRPTILAGRDCGQIPVRLESRPMHVVFPVLLFAWRHVADPAYADRPQGDARDPLPRRPDAAGQARRPRRARRRPQRGAGRRASATGCPVLADGTVVDAANVVWAPASGRSSTGSTCRSSARTAGRGVPRRRRRRARPVLLRPVVPVRVQLDGAPRRRPRRGPRRRAGRPSRCGAGLGSRRSAHVARRQSRSCAKA